jgi:CheY-like chemotaxis protein
MTDPNAPPDRRPDQTPDRTPDARSLSDAGDDPRSLRHLSHDIRAAMSDVIGGLRLVDPTRLDPQTQTQIDRVRAAADTLAALVDHVLFEAAGERPTIRDVGPVVLEDWLHGLAQRWRGPAAEQDRTFRIIREGRLPARLKVSPVALTRVVGNLVANALRHVSHGDVDVRISALPDGAVEVEVCDEGPGFPEAVLEGRAPRQPGATAGSGLGLRIARDLSRELGLALTLHNRAEGTGVAGARAMLRIGRELTDDTEMPYGPSQNVDLSGLRLLVAEDNLTNQTILRHMLEPMGAQTDFVEDGRSALRALSEVPYNLALLDIEMPEMSGLEVMEAVRAMPGKVAAMPLVAITAYVLRDNREAIYAAGADGIIGKPVPSAEDLGRAILRHVGDATQGNGDTGQPVLSEDTFLDRGRMDRLLEAAGPDGRAELLQRLGEDLAVTLEAMDRAVAQNDTAEMRAQTHILIAISGAVGADRLCHNAETLNIAAKRHSAERFAVLVPPIRADLVALIEEVAQRRANDSAGA